MIQVLGHTQSKSFCMPITSAYALVGGPRKVWLSVTPESQQPQLLYQSVAGVLKSSAKTAKCVVSSIFVAFVFYPCPLGNKFS